MGSFIMMLLFISALAAGGPVLLQSAGGGVSTNPIGIFLRHDVAADTGLLPAAVGEGFWGDIRLGAFTQYLVVSTEFGARVSWLTRPQLLVVSLEAATEPGLFVVDGDDQRSAHVRSRFTGQALLNLKLSHWWFYSRSTASMRLRDFVERDQLQNIVVKDELTLEQATALFTRLYTLKTLGRVPAQLWFYAEYTVGTLYDLKHGLVDVRPNRISVGLLSEHFPLRNFVMDLDVSWSFADSPRPGPGVLFLYGFAF